jgi:hypothetical protein
MRTLQRWFLLSAASLLGTGALGCSDEKNTGPDGTGGGSSGNWESNGPGKCSGTTRPANDAFCHGNCASEPACKNATSFPVDSCCVQIGAPGLSATSPYLERTTDTKEYADPSGAAPDLGCFDPAGYPAKPGSSSGTASLVGILKVFANGGCEPTGATSLEGVKIEVYTVKRTGDPATDGALDQLVGTPLVVDSSMKVVQEPVQNKCTGGIRYNREYEYKNVPINTELVVKTSGAGWTDFYAYNLFIGEGDPAYDAAKGTYTYNVRALAEDDYSTIPQAAIGKPPTSGYGIIGGEVHDCDNVRLQNARVDLSLPRLALEYFNADEDNPLPEGSRRTIGTGRTALYAAFDIQVSGPEGSFARVAGTGLVKDGDKDKLVSLGYFDVRVYPDAVTSVSLRGLRPFQVP